MNTNDFLTAFQASLPVWGLVGLAVYAHWWRRRHTRKAAERRSMWLHSHERGDQ